MNLKTLLLGSAISLITNQAYAQLLRTNAFPSLHSISNTGLVAGYNNWAGPYYIWNPDTGITENIGGIAPGNNHGGVAIFSNDGKYLSGTSLSGQSPDMGEMSRYNLETKKWETLGTNENYTGTSSDYSSGFYTSGDGKTIVGLAYNINKRAIGFAWNETSGKMPLPSADPNSNARANAVSNDGSVIVGWRDVKGNWKSAVWTRNADGSYNENKILLVNPNGNPNDAYNQLAEARAVSGDGKWVGGKTDYAFKNPWIWSEETGVVDLGTLATPDENNVASWVTSINYDGSIVLGYTTSKQWVDSSPVYKPFIWTKGGGIKDFNTFVTNDLGISLGNDKINVPTMMSANQKYILGWTAAPGGIQVLRIELPEKFLANQEVLQNGKISIYPNPVNDILKIDSDIIVDSVAIYNLAGQVIYSSKMNTKTVSINTAKYQAGVYMVAVKSGAHTTTYKVIKK